MKNDLASKRVGSWKVPNPFIAGMLSFILLGMGQAYNGQTRKAYMFLGSMTLLFIILYFTTTLPLFRVQLILWLILYPICIVDAVYSAARFNKEEVKIFTHSMKSLGIFLKNVALAILISLLVIGPTLLVFFRSISHNVKKYVAVGNLDQATEELNKGIRLNRNWLEGHYDLGWIYERKGNYNQAISEFTKAIQIRPGYSDSYAMRGYVYSKKGDLNQAVSDFSKALEINPNNLKAYNNRANAYFRKGDKEKGVSDFNEVIKRVPHSESAYYAHNNVGFYFFEKNNFNQSLLEYNEAIKIKPDYAIAYFNRGLAYYIIERYDKTLADYRKAITLDSDTKGAYEDFMKYVPEKKPSDLANMREKILKLLKQPNNPNAI